MLGLDVLIEQGSRRCDSSSANVRNCRSTRLGDRYEAIKERMMDQEVEECR